MCVVTIILIPTLFLKIVLSLLFVVRTRLEGERREKKGEIKSGNLFAASRLYSNLATGVEISTFSDDGQIGDFHFGGWKKGKGAIIFFCNGQDLRAQQPDFAPLLHQNL